MLKNLGYLFIDKFIRLIFGLFITTKIIQYLGPTNFGIISYSLVVVYFITPIIVLGFDSILVKELILNPEKVNNYIFSAIVLRLFSGIVINIITFIFISQYFSVDSPITTFSIILGITAIFNSLTSIFDSYFQSIYKNKYSVIIQLSTFLFLLIIRYILIINKAELTSFVICYLVESLLSLCITIIYSYKKLKLNKKDFNIQIVKKLFYNGLPITISILAIAIYTKIDQFFITNSLGLYKLGVYTAALRISDLLFIIPTIFNTLFYPSIVSSFSRSIKSYRVTYAFGMIIYLSIILAIFIFFSSNFIILKLYGIKYYDSILVLKTYSLLSIFNATGIFISSLLFITNLQKYATYSAIVGGFCSIVLNYYLTPIRGIIGVLEAAVFSQIISLFSLFILSKEARKIIPIFFNALNLNKLSIYLFKFFKKKLINYV